MTFLRSALLAPVTRITHFWAEGEVPGSYVGAQ